MTNQQFEKLAKGLETMNKLLILLLRKFEIKDDLIANAMSIKQARLSQILPQKINKKGAKDDR